MNTMYVQNSQTIGIYFRFESYCNSMQII